MRIHFNHSELAYAPAEVLHAVITDYEHYPTFNSAVRSVDVACRDETGAVFSAGRKTRVEKNTSAHDTYTHVDADFVIDRTYGAKTDARSTWTIHPVDDSESILTIDASMTMPWWKGLVMKPLLRRVFYGINFMPFITEAERRVRPSTDWPRVA